MLQAAIPVALKKAKPGTPEFRAALRDALEQAKDLVLCHGIATMTPAGPQRLRPARAGDGDHQGRRVEAAALKMPDIAAGTAWTQASAAGEAPVMDPTIALILVQDGIVNGAIYALLALSLVLVFAVTRVVFIPQGEFVAYGALTYAALDAGQMPGSVWLLCALGAAACLASLWSARQPPAAARHRARLLAATLALPVVVLLLTRALAPLHPGVLVQALLALLIVTPMAPYLYRVAFRPLAHAPCWCC